MTLRTLRRGLPALVVALAASPAAAGDGPFHRDAHAGVPCTNCDKHWSRAGSDCPTCVNGKYGIGFRKRPTIPTLAPGACFGYFPTQWSRWQDVCPHPYPGSEFDDPGNVSTAKKTPPKSDPKGDGKPDPAPEPRPSSDTTPPADPKGKGGELPKPSSLPSIPDAPKGGTPPPPGVPMPNIPQVPPPGAGGAAPKPGKP